MNRMSVCLFTLALLLAVSTPLAAQEDTYVVQPGDTLCVLEGTYNGNPDQWRHLVEENPYLKEPGRIFQDEKGRTIVIIRPGERLRGLMALGIIPTPLPIEQLRLPQPEPVVYHVPTTPAWIWWLLGAIPVGITVGIIHHAFQRRDPTRVGAGRVRENGIHTPPEAAEYFRTRVAREVGSGIQPSMIRIISMIRGRGFGSVQVMDNLRELFSRTLNGEVTWQATVQPPTGPQEIRYTLAACANDLRWGGGVTPGEDFRFVADQNVTDQIQPAPVPEPVLEPEPTPVAPTPHTGGQGGSGDGAVTAPAPVAPAPVPVAEVQAPVPQPAPAPQPAGVITFEFKRSNNGQPNMVRLQGIEAEEFTFSVGPDGTTLRYREVEEPVTK